MSRIAEDLAGRYAEAVVDVLADCFPTLAADNGLRKCVIEGTAEQAANPDRRFELIVTYSRAWRLHPADRGDDEWRVRLGYHDDYWSEADKRFSDSVNARLRAIQLEA